MSQDALRRIEHKQDVILRVLHVILSTGQFDMAKIHDDIAAALANNDSALAANATKMDTLIALKTEGDSAFSDILTSVQGQGQTIANQGSVLDAALAADQGSSAAVGHVDDGTDATTHLAGAAGGDAEVSHAEIAPGATGA